MIEHTHEDTQPAASALLARVLRPIIRFMIHLRLPLQTFIEVAKAVYVEMAETHHQEGGRLLSDTRLAALTGVHRRDVRRMREAMPRFEFAPPSNLALLATAWGSLEQYMENGMRRPLARRAAGLAAAQDGSFDALIEAALPGSSPTELWNQLLASEMVVLLPDGRLEMGLTWSVRSPLLNDHLTILATTLQDTIAARIENAIGGPPLKHRSMTVFSAAAPNFLAGQLNRLFDEQAAPMMHGWNQVIAHAEGQLVPGQPLVRVGCSLTVYSVPIGGR